MSGDSYWAGIWSDAEIAPLILQHGRIFALTQRNLERGLARSFGSLEGRRLLDFGCGDGLLLSRIRCAERLLYEPSPLYRRGLDELDCPHATTVVDDLDALRTPLDLVVMNGVAHYMSLEELTETLGRLRAILREGALGVLIADLPHPNRMLDVLGALGAHPATVVEVVRQVMRLSGSRYSWERLIKHRLVALEHAAASERYRLRRLPLRSFNRARSTVLLEPVSY